MCVREGGVAFFFFFFSVLLLSLLCPILSSLGKVEFLFKKMCKLWLHRKEIIVLYPRVHGQMLK